MIRWRHSLWQLLGSRQLAVILLVTLLFVLLLASLVPQMPAEPSAQEAWLGAVRLRYGPATGLMRRLGMFGVFQSPWFLALFAALLLNTLICTVQRLPRLWRSLTVPPPVQRPRAFFQGFAHRAEWTLSSLEQGLAAVRDTLGRHRFSSQVDRDERTGCVSLYAERGRWSQAATLVGHVAAVLLATAVACRPALGWQESNLTLVPGELHGIGHGYDLEVRTGLLVLEPEPMVPLAVLTNRSAFTETVLVNHPLAFHGIRFHLQGYGPALQVAAPEGSFGAAFSGSQAQQVTLPEAGLTLRVAHRLGESALFVEALAAGGVLLGSGSVTPGQEIEIGGIPITLNLSNYTVWQVSRDPTFALAVVSAILLLAAMVTSLWVPHRRLWVRLGHEGKAWMAGAGDWGGEFDTIAGEMARACLPQGESDG